MKTRDCLKYFVHVCRYKIQCGKSQATFFKHFVDFSTRHVDRHSRQLSYEIKIFNFFNNLKKFWNIFNGSVDSSFSVIILILILLVMTIYTELITVSTEMKNVFLENFDYQRPWKTVALIVCFTSFNFIPYISSIFIVSMSS